MTADIIEAWNEAEELNCSLRELNDKDLIDCREALINRSQIIMNLFRPTHTTGEIMIPLLKFSKSNGKLSNRLIFSIPAGTPAPMPVSAIHLLSERLVKLKTILLVVVSHQSIVALLLWQKLDSLLYVSPGGITLTSSKRPEISM